MGLRPATMRENSLFDTKSFISNHGFGYFHGSRSLRLAAPRNNEKGREGSGGHPAW
jgi:hypothetical protein